MVNNLIRQLEKLTESKVELTEGEVDLQLKKRFYGVSADFEKDLNRLINFYEFNAAQHPELKPLLKRVKKLKSAFEAIFTYTEAFIDNGTGEEIVEEEETSREPNVGESAQVYAKGEAFIGPLIAYGQVKGKQGKADGYFKVSFDPYVPHDDHFDIGPANTEEPRTWYDTDNYDIVKIDLEEKTFQKIYPKKRPLAEADPIDTETPEVDSRGKDNVQPAEPKAVEKKKIEPKKVEPKKEPIQQAPQELEPEAPSQASNPKEFGLVAQQTKDLIDIVQRYVQPSEKDIASARKVIYDEFLSILKRYNTELPLDASQASIETLQSLNEELKSFIEVYEIPTT